MNSASDHPEPKSPAKVNPDQVNPDQVNPDPARPDPLRPDPARSDPLRPDPLRPTALRPTAAPEASQGSPAPAHPLHVSMVCTGNICRSPMAEAVLARHIQQAGLDQRIVVDSAGTHDYHVGRPADPRAMALLRAAGYPLDHVARRFEASWLTTTDLVLAMDAGHHRHLVTMAAAHGMPADRILMLRDFDPEGPGDVPDPYYAGVPEFQEVLVILERSIPAVLAHVREMLDARG